MRLSYIYISAIMTALDLLRRKIVILLLFVIPTVFYTVTRLTSGLRELPFKLASLSEDTFLLIPERHIALIFIGLASVGILSSFLSMNLIQRNSATNRRLIVCGYKTSELAISKLSVMFGIVVLVGFYIALLLLVFFSPHYFGRVALGFILVGFVYGSYGLLIGAVIKGELEGILLITLLANIDVGWLQNPLFYAGAMNQSIIKGLPAFYPSQVSIISAFSDYNVGRAVFGSTAYGCALLFVALFIYWLKMRSSRKSKSSFI